MSNSLMQNVRDDIASGAAKKQAELAGVNDELLSAGEKLIEALRVMHNAAEDFEPFRRKFLQDLLAFRMSALSEISYVTKQLEDLRKFFLGKDYEQEIARLREFVTLCERLKALKDSGFLDAVADTMLKLA